MDSLKSKTLVPSTSDMLVQTSHYMTFLMEEILMIPPEQIPDNVKKISKDVLFALKNFKQNKENKKDLLYEMLSLVSEFETSHVNSTTLSNTASSSFTNGIANSCFTEGKKNLINDEDIYFHNEKDQIETGSSQVQINIPASFKDFLKTISSASIISPHNNSLIYCQPCNTGFVSKRKWKDHVKKDQSKHNEIPEFWCQSCNLKIYCSVDLGMEYFTFHEAEVHPKFFVSENNLTRSYTSPNQTLLNKDKQTTLSNTGRETKEVKDSSSSYSEENQSSPISIAPTVSKYSAAKYFPRRIDNEILQIHDKENEL